MDFVDDELSGEQRSDFLAHALSCPICDRELKEIQQVRRVLANLTPITASPEFDFNLRTSLIRENTLMSSPFYRMRLYFQDNIRAFITVPAAAALLAAGFFFYSENGIYHYPGSQYTTKNTLQNNDPAYRIITDASDEDVNYVLESVDQSETWIGTLPLDTSSSRNISTNTVTLISF
jgi:hypothetical protein